jgi:hypothetical protein
MTAGKHACLVSDHNVENAFFRKSGGRGPLPTCINNEKYSVHAVCTCRSKEQRICFHMFCFFLLGMWTGGHGDSKPELTLAHTWWVNLHFMITFAVYLRIFCRSEFIARRSLCSFQAKDLRHGRSTCRRPHSRRSSQDGVGSRRDYPYAGGSRLGDVARRTCVASPLVEHRNICKC